MYKITLDHTTFAFPDLKMLMAKATPLRSGDQLAGIAAKSMEEHVAAQMCLADVPLRRFLEEPLIDYEKDEVTRLVFDTHDAGAFAPISDLTVGEFRNTIGLQGTMASRLQPNSPTDDLKGIAASIIDGLMYGCGDAVIGINPASDSVPLLVNLEKMLDAVITNYEIPTQSCVLSHITTGIEMIERGAPIDLLFQSIAGTEKANAGFGINLKLLDEGYDAVRSLHRGTLGDNCMYFETGQGSALSSDANFGVDEQTCECRCYAVARRYHPLLVNTVVGFIGPEYLYDGKQITRAGLEDHFCGKLMGVPMGCDICYTNHAEADQDDMDNLLLLLGVAGVSYVMGIPGADDIMLGYQSTSFHDVISTRKMLGKRPAPEFEQWLEKMKLFNAEGRILQAAPTHALMKLVG
ncbi:MAG: ethanolamine ammonia-lyase subunit EutB [Prevotella sp.]|nr:ethanolamine ammonia-lyase subunit EutB [Prevotella sp.]